MSDAQIERLVEAKSWNSDVYAERTFTPEQIAAGRHRSFIGGHWDSHGQHQLTFLVEHGLQPGDTFLDVGCGCFRAGRFLIDYLDPARYYGIDANIGLLTAGWDHELTDAHRAKLPIGNLRANDRFNCDFGGVTFDMAIAQSVFTHVSLNHVRLCLYRVAEHVRPGGKFYATFYEQPRHRPLDAEKPGGRYMFPERNPFWYYRSDLEWASTIGPWAFAYLGEWGHPNKQKMVEFTRLDDAEWQARKARATRAERRSPADRARRVVVRGRRWAARRLDPS